MTKTDILTHSFPSLERGMNCYSLNSKTPPTVKYSKYFYELCRKKLLFYFYIYYN